VISTGPYALVRHPMYAGAMLLILFTSVALGSWVGVPFSLPLTLVIVARLLDEERFLKASLSGYEEYCQKVRYRLVPLIW
jgi:protein-S-isoprenylcysteine O-methyltransferase Ste14